MDKRKSVRQIIDEAYSYFTSMWRECHSYIVGITIEDGDDQVFPFSVFGLEKWSKGDEKLEGCREYFLSLSLFFSPITIFPLVLLSALSSAPIISFALQDINDRKVSPVCKVFRFVLSQLINRHDMNEKIQSYVIFFFFFLFVTMELSITDMVIYLSWQWMKS